MNVNLNYKVNKTKQNKYNTQCFVRCDKNVFHYLCFVVLKQLTQCGVVLNQQTQPTQPPNTNNTKKILCQHNTRLILLIQNKMKENKYKKFFWKAQIVISYLAQKLLILRIRSEYALS